MVRRTLRVLAAVAVVAAIVAAIVVVLRRRAPSPTATPAPAPKPTPTSTPDSPAPAADGSPPSTEPSTPAWLPPVDGQCPDGHPVKVNESSGIFHVPGGRFYARTIPDRCYATADGATADGYRQAKA